MLSRSQSIARLAVGDVINLTIDQAERLAAAYFDTIAERFAEDEEPQSSRGIDQLVTGQWTFFVVDVHVALADPIRRDLLRRLVLGPARVVDLAASHDASRPAISRHLRILSDAGLVNAATTGLDRRYSLDATQLNDVQQLLDELTGSRPLIASRHLDALDTESHRATRDRRQSNDTTITRTDQERSA